MHLYVSVFFLGDVSLFDHHYRVYHLKIITILVFFLSSISRDGENNTPMHSGYLNYSFEKDLQYTQKWHPISV